jgi:hypothetical protein
VNHLQELAARDESLASDDESVDLDNIEDSVADSDSDMDRPLKRAKRHSKTPYDGERKGKPTQMQFFPPHWKDVLEMAKKAKRFHLVKFRPFPEREKHLPESTDCLTESLSEYRGKGGRVEPGPFHSNFQNCIHKLFFHRLLSEI